MASKFVFAMKNGEIIHIGDLPVTLKGLKCGAVCPLCNEPLLARMGDVKSHYFAHYSNSPCEFNNESALHLLAKQLICESNTITLPAVSLKYVIKAEHHKETDEYLDYTEEMPIIVDEIIKKSYIGMDFYDYKPYKDNEMLSGFLSEPKHYYFGKNTRIRFDAVLVEKGYYGKIIDLIGEKNGSKLGIEIKVTHPVDQEKKQYLRDNNLPTIEIDLSGYIDTDLGDFNIEDFKKMLIDTTENKSWIVIKDEISRLNEADEKLKAEFLKINEAKLKNANYRKEQQKIDHMKQIESLNYFTNKKDLYDLKNYKKIQEDYFIPKNMEMDMQNKLAKAMSKSPRFNHRYIGRFIPTANLYFNCDFKTWQAIIFYKFIFSNDIGAIFTINDIISFFFKTESIKGYFDKHFYMISKDQYDTRNLHTNMDLTKKQML